VCGARNFGQNNNTTKKHTQRGTTEGRKGIGQRADTLAKQPNTTIGDKGGKGREAT